MFVLRPYQLETNRALWKAFREYDSVLLQAPTGAGKTLMFSHLIAMRREHLKEPVLVLAHRREIVNQTAEKIMDVGIECGIIMAGHAPMPWCDVQVGSIDTLWSRKGGGFPPAKFLVIDEAHRAAGDRYQKVIEHYLATGAKLLGATATPMRMDGRGLKNIFSKMVRTPDVPELQALGYLVPVSYRVGLLPDMSKVPVTAGDYNAKAREEALDQGRLIGDAVGNWLHHARDRKTMLFAPGVKVSIGMADKFKAEGIAATHVDGDTPKEERDKVYADLHSGILQLVTNAQVYVEGTDIPCIDCIVDYSPTKSLMKYLQAGGRGMRPFPGKKDLLYLDHAGNVTVQGHGRLEIPRDWILTVGKEQVDHLAAERKRTEKLPIVCERCGFMHNKVVCPLCGFTFIPTGEAADFLPGMLVEMTIGEYEDAVAKKRKAKMELPPQVWYQGLLYIARERNYSDGWAAHAYREKFGNWPSFSKVAAPPHDAVRKWEQSRRIARAKAMKKAAEEEARAEVYNGAF